MRLCAVVSLSVRRHIRRTLSLSWCLTARHALCVPRPPHARKIMIPSGGRFHPAIAGSVLRLSHPPPQRTNKNNKQKITPLIIYVFSFVIFSICIIPSYLCLCFLKTWHFLKPFHTSKQNYKQQRIHHTPRTVQDNIDVSFSGTTLGGRCRSGVTHPAPPNENKIPAIAGAPLTSALCKASHLQRAGARPSFARRFPHAYSSLKPECIGFNSSLSCGGKLLALHPPHVLVWFIVRGISAAACR